MTGGRHTVHVVLPAGTDDPDRPSGGHAYNRRVCRGLAAAGWAVHERQVPGAWPWPDATAERHLAEELDRVPACAVVLIDGLVASAVPDVVVPATRRLAVVVLVHMPLGEQFLGHRVQGAFGRESAVLSAARSVITTSDWTRSRLLERYGLDPDAVQVCRPGVEPAALAVGTPSGGSLLCVAAVAPHKGQDLLVHALASLADRRWHCRFVGPLDRDPDFVARLRRQAEAAGLAARIEFSGALSGAALDDAYAHADVVVSASHAETYGMVLTEALARGLPVIATAVGGVPEAVGTTVAGQRPGILVPAGDAVALSGALRGWLDDADLRRRLRQAAADRRPMLAGWGDTAARVGSVLVAAAGDLVARSGWA